MFKKNINMILVGVLSLVVVLAIGGLVWYVSDSSRKMALEMRRESLSSIGTLLGKALTDKNEEGVVLLRNLAGRRTIIAALNGGPVEPALNQFKLGIQNAEKQYATMLAFDLQGQLVAGYNSEGRELVSGDYTDRDYVRRILGGEELYVSDTLIQSKTTGRMILSIAAPVRDDSGRLLGGVALFPDMDVVFEHYLASLRFGEGGYVFVTDKNGRILFHPDKSLYLSDLSSHDFIAHALKIKNGEADYTFQGVEKFMVFRHLPLTNWSIMLTAHHSEMAAGAAKQSSVMLGVGGVMVLVIIGLIIFFTRRLIFDPMSRILVFIQKIGKGDYQATLPGEFRYELGVLADGIKGMVAEIKNKVGFSDGILKAITSPYVVADEKDQILQINQKFLDLLGRSGAPKDYTGQHLGEVVYNDRNKASLTNKAVLSRKPVLNVEGKLPTQQGTEVEVFADASPVFDLDGNLLAGFGLFTDLTEIKAQQREIEAQNKRIAATAERALSVAEQMAGAAEELSAQVEQSSQGAVVQRERVAETATAMEEMNATVLEVARNASGAAEGTDMTKDKALKGQEIVQHSIEAITLIQKKAQAMQGEMQILGKQAEDIGQIMNVISDIADQTNLLALNAAIEAARAGEAGRGFAVVADEVRKLAEKTMDATKEVGRAINTIQQGTRGAVHDMEQAAAAVEEATELASSSGEALREIVYLVEKATDQVRSIATASEEQSAASEEINHAIDEINRVSTETADAMNQSAQAVADLARLAQDLNALIRDLEG